MHFKHQQFVAGKLLYIYGDSALSKKFKKEVNNDERGNNHRGNHIWTTDSTSIHHKRVQSTHTEMSGSQ